MRAFATVFFLTFLMIPEAYCQTEKPSFSAWLLSFKQEAKTAGISDTTLRTLDSLEFNPQVIALDRKQPESKKTFDRYSSDILSQQGIAYARKMYREHFPLLSKIGKTYGVQPQYIVALWGIETNFGRNTGNYHILQSLATLAYEGRRHAFFKNELLQALTMIEMRQASAAMMKGSWAGAMGQTQFMPSSFRKFAVDYDKNGKADIWGSKADAFASIANYLSKTGWDAEASWGRKITLPKGFDRTQAKFNLEKPVIEWQNIGVRTVNGTHLPQKPLLAAIVIPGDGDKAFLVYSNYQTIMDWNKSTYFATTVGLFADAIVKR